MADTARIFIDGEAGTTGLGIRDRLAAIRGIELRSLSGDSRKDPVARRAIMAEVDLVVLCLPDAAARESVEMAESLGAAAPKLLDASTAHRIAPGWVYGLPELSPDQPGHIARAGKVANPGCYPTGAVALLRPLVDAGLMAQDHPVSINAISGYSGGGKAMIGQHAAGADQPPAPAFELYGLSLEHKHIPEIQAYARLTRRPIFAPSVGHFRQGMLVSIPLHLDTLPGRPDAAALHAALAARYADSPLVRVLPPSADGKLAPEALNETDLLELRVYANPAHRQAILVARLDNLGKGASGAAVQNIGLMLGLRQIAESHAARYGASLELAHG